MTSRIRLFCGGGESDSIKRASNIHDTNRAEQQRELYWKYSLQTPPERDPPKEPTFR
uniref:Uncharacterized protein n=1 Tax=Arundo donax TaxID=35708 RepID=A0A0A9F4P7_ARUDO